MRPDKFTSQFQQAISASRAAATVAPAGSSIVSPGPSTSRMEAK